MNARETRRVQCPECPALRRALCDVRLKEAPCFFRYSPSAVRASAAGKPAPALRYETSRSLSRRHTLKRNGTLPARERHRLHAPYERVIVCGQKREACPPVIVQAVLFFVSIVFSYWILFFLFPLHSTAVDDNLMSPCLPSSCSLPVCVLSASRMSPPMPSTGFPALEKEEKMKL